MMSPRPFPMTVPSLRHFRRKPVLTAKSILRAVLTAGFVGALATPSLAQPCTTPGPDVIVGAVGGSATDSSATDGISDYNNLGSIDAFSIGSTSCNIGGVWLNWFAGNNQHPVIGQNAYRLKTVDGSARFECVGISWLKHAFFALSNNLCCGNACQGTNGQHLGVGCSDPYTSGRNGQQQNNGSTSQGGGLGPRFQVNAHTGAYPYPYAHVTSSGAGMTSIQRRLQVNAVDADPAQNTGARYFFEIQYVSPDDATTATHNQDNNVSYREGAFTVLVAGTNFNASMAGFSTQRTKPAIQAWKDVDPSVTLTVIDAPEATSGDLTSRAILAAKATDLGGGVWHYEYALYNMNSDRSFDGFSIPADAAASVTNIGFHDVTYHSGDGFNSTPAVPVNFDGTDWPGAFAGGAVSWDVVPAAPVENSNAVRWGTLYNFRFDSNRAPTTGNATISMFKAVAGLPDSIDVSTVVPSAGTPCVGDTDGSGAVDVDDLVAVILGWGPCGKSCPADIDNSGTVDVDDLVAVILAWGPCA
jgi:hypothetical protein